MRTSKFYNELSKIKNISFIDYDIDSKLLFKKLKLLFLLLEQYVLSHIFLKHLH